MTSKDTIKMTLTAGAAAMASGQAVAAIDTAAVDKALETLKTYDWGDDRNLLNPIDQAVLATEGDAGARRKLEKQLVDLLAGGISRSALDYVCRTLRIIGTGQCVNALAPLLTDEKTSHIARYALERIPDAQAIAAMRDALPQVDNKLKAGIIGSLGKRRNRQSIRAIAPLLRDPDPQVAQAAARALALIGTPGAGRRLSGFAKQAPAHMKVPVADACLFCAEQLLANGRKDEAVTLYEGLRGDDQPKQVKVAAMKGMLTAASQK